MRVAVIIPARNEADALGHVLSGLPRELIHELVVVDNGSTDGTAEVARRHGARVVVEPIPGYGRACLAGLAALDPSVDTVVFVDADHADDPDDLPRLLAPLREGRADLVIGSRVQKAQPGSLTWAQRIGNRLACWLMRLCFGVRHTDLGPFRAIRRSALERLAMRDDAFGWTAEMQAKAARAQLRVVEVPVSYRRRIGRSKISGTFRGTFRAGWGILSTILRVAVGPPLPSDRRLLIFLKAPTPTQVKVRIAAAIGFERAAEIYRICIQLTLEHLRTLRQEAVLYVDPPAALESVQAWLGGYWTFRPQQGTALGERLSHAAAEAFAEGAARVVVIGTDSPWLRRDDIEEAFGALDAADLVVGPTEDGGYYLLGIRQPQPALFEGIMWSTSSVFQETMAKAQALGLHVHTLRLGYDVDRVEDFHRLADMEKLERLERGEA